MRTKNLATLFLIYVMASGSLLWSTDVTLVLHEISNGDFDGLDVGDFDDVDLGDLDGDGDIDLVGCSYDDDPVVIWMENDGNQNFTEHLLSIDEALDDNHPAGYSGEDPWDLVVADLDTDGDLDIIVSNYGEWFIDVWLNDGTGVFTLQILSNSVANAWKMNALDMDQDGDIDLFASGIYNIGDGNDNFFIWFENDGSLNFTPHEVAETDGSDHYYIRCSYATDLDNDGDIDFIGADDNGWTTVWYENDGSQNFTDHVISTSRLTLDVHAADVDGDGDMDVLTSDFGTNSWHENDGNQNFTEHLLEGSCYRSDWVRAADIDNDGDMDIFSDGYGALKWYENDGSENFTFDTESDLDGSVQRVIPRDIDRDGDIDLAVCGAKIAWIENTTDLVHHAFEFASHEISTSADYTYSVHAADVDSDGDMDVLSASYYDDKIAWYENNGSESFTEHAIST
ncbi:MAG TPA: VCBS repeat-containing protein, partial [Candidatus Marinimicrobia bacterium]|nr:VCBS repeat-containing protein [Candidatus Neomarinimicrobiota bacterium]